MVNQPMFADAPVIAGVNAVTALVNAGTPPGLLKIYSAATGGTNGLPADANTALPAGGTLLATLTFNSTAFVNPAVASGAAGSRLVTATANAIVSGTAVATGTAAFFAITNAAGGVIALGTCGTSGCDLNMNSVAISNGATVACSAFTITQPEQ